MTLNSMKMIRRGTLIRAVFGLVVWLLVMILAGEAQQTYASAGKLLIPMDLKQTDHLKAYGVAYWSLTHGVEVDWLLNYRGGSFTMDYNDLLATECRVRGVSFETLSASDAAQLYALIAKDDNNMDAVLLEKAPKVAVYVPPGFKPWDDAVTLALEYAEIPYEKVWDDEVLGWKVGAVRLAPPPSRRFHRTVWEVLPELQHVSVVHRSANTV